MKNRNRFIPLLLLTVFLLGMTLFSGRLGNLDKFIVQPAETGLLSLSLPAFLFPGGAQIPPISIQESESDLILDRARQQIEWDDQGARAVYQVNRIRDIDSAASVYLQVAGQIYTQPPPTRLVTEFADAGIYTCARDNGALRCSFVGLYTDHVVTLSVIMGGGMNLPAFLEAVEFIDRQMGKYIGSSGRQL